MTDLSRVMLERIAREEDKLKRKLSQQLAKDISRVDTSQLVAGSKLLTIISTQCKTSVNPDNDPPQDDAANHTAPEQCENSSMIMTVDGVSELGNDLLTLYHCSVETDVCVLVGDREFQVHRSILAARSEYFSAMLCGGWQESDGGRLTIHGVSPPAFECVLHFIYGGMLTFNPSEQELRHLVVVTDMYMLSGFLDMVLFLMKKYYCHFFHKPCAGCSVGVIQVMNLVHSYHNFQSILHTAVEWVNKNFTRMWVTEGFAKLPKAVLKDCSQSLINSLEVGNVLSIVEDTSYMLERLTPRHSFQPVNEVLVRVREACVSYIANHFEAVICHRSFIDLNKGRSWGIITLEHILTDALKQQAPVKLCDSYWKLNDVLNQLSVGGILMVGQEFLCMLRSLTKSCKQQIAAHVNEIVDTEGWKLLPFTIQKEITEQAYFVRYGGGGATSKKPQLFSQTKKVAKPKSLDPPKPIAQRKTSKNLSHKQKLDNLKRNKDFTSSSESVTTEVEPSTSDTKCEDRESVAPATSDTQCRLGELLKPGPCCQNGVDDLQYMNNGFSDVRLPDGLVFDVDVIKPVLNVQFYKPG